MIKSIATEVISSFTRFSSAVDRQVMPIFFIAGVSAVSVGVSLQWGLPIGLIVFGALLLLPVANKLR